MGTKISWTDETWNPVLGCTHVSDGCTNCYAAREASGRLRAHPLYEGLTRWGKFTGKIRLVPDRLDQPLRWRRPRRIFVNSMSDLFHPDVPEAFIGVVFEIMWEAERHQFQILTKRHARMRSLLTSWTERGIVRDLGYRFGGKPTGELRVTAPLWTPPPNVWLGVSVEDQHWANIRVPALLQTPAAVRFLSCEPLLGPIDLDFDHECGDPPHMYCPPLPDWVIVGGESGPQARPMHPAWARSLRDQCLEAGVAFHFKQWGEYLSAEVRDDPTMFGNRSYASPTGGKASPVIRTVGPSGTFRTGETRLLRPGERTRGTVMLDEDTIAVRVGKATAGNMLDGRTWEEYPEEVRPAPWRYDTRASG